MNDREITDLLFARDEQAISEVDEKYGRLCHDVAMRILFDAGDAEECVNDAYMALWDTVPPNRPDSLRSYLCCLVRRNAVNMLRRGTAKKRFGGISVSLDELAECIPDTAHDDELKELLLSFVDSLPDLDRRLFLGRYWYNYQPAELAKEYCLTRGAVNLRMMRLREKLKDHLTKGGYKL